MTLPRFVILTTQTANPHSPTYQIGELVPSCLPIYAPAERGFPESNYPGSLQQALDALRYAQDHYEGRWNTRS